MFAISLLFVKLSWDKLLRTFGKMVKKLKYL